MNENNRPNVLLIMVDQWRGDCLGVAGHPRVRTPFLDRLANSGARFTRAYSATPTCIPARASLMTGQRPATHGRVGYQDLVPWHYDTTMAGEFTRNGYQTEAIGKMHFYPERTAMGFEHTVLHSPLGIVRSTRRAGGDPDLVDDYLPWLRQQLGRDATYFDHGIDSNSWVARPWDKPEYTHPTNFVAGQAADFLRRRDPTRPFFLYVSFNAPHPPYDPPEWAMQQYLDNEDDYRAPVGDWAEEFQQYEKPGDPTSMVSHPDDDQLRRARAGYWGHMSHLDQQINYLLEELAHRGLRDNTYIVFTSDHGEMLGDHHQFRKGQPYEGSTRIPMLVSGPGIPAGVVRDEVVELGDIMPTLLESVGAPVPETVEGRSMLGLAATADDLDQWRPWLHGEHTLIGQSLQWLTDGREKYIWFSGSGYEQLFDLEADPQECHNLAADPAAAQRVAQWRDRLIGELTGREEGFTDGSELITGRPVSPVLRSVRAHSPS